MSANDRSVLILLTTRFLSLAKTTIRQSIALTSTLLLAICGLAQENVQPTPQPDSQTTSQELSSAKPAPAPTIVTVPAGTRIALVLTQPIQTRNLRRGDDIYAQIVSPVTSGNEVVIPAGTFVQGKLDKVERHGQRGVVHLQSMAITFPDGYVAPIPGPITLDSPDGYALIDPSNRRGFTAVALPAAGAGVGALIGHFAANPQPNTITSTLPPGCTGPPPGCLSSSVTAPGSTGKATVIGAMVGGGIGAVASLALIFKTHNFFLDIGAPVEMILQHPLSMKEGEVAEAMRDVPPKLPPQE